VAELTPDEDQAELIEANARFYRAFESFDLGQMEQVWSHADHVRCIHPGWALLAGWDAVRESCAYEADRDAFGMQVVCYALSREDWRRALAAESP
jgi:SnoaL-like domain